jgi:hypothetical protein
VLKLCAQAATLPKRGSRAEEYEDAWQYDNVTGRYAIADGASDAFESRLWSRALVDSYVLAPPPGDLEAILQWLQPLSQAWQQQVNSIELPWYALAKADLGSFATFLGLSFVLPDQEGLPDNDQQLSWQAIALGDACCFQIRDESVVTYFPVRRASDFGTTPALLSTKLDYTRKSIADLQLHAGAYRVGDLFVLATDALAEWFLRSVESSGRPWQLLLELRPDSFADAMEHLRQHAGMRNDDVTLLIIKIEENAEEILGHHVVEQPTHMLDVEPVGEAVNPLPEQDADGDLIDAKSYMDAYARS